MKFGAAFSLGVFCLSLLGAPLLKAECKPLKAEQIAVLQDLAKQQKTKLVFFASWCGACADHVKNLKPSEVLIAVFDEQASAARAVQSIGNAYAKSSCYWDADGSLAEKWKVKSLPASRELSEVL